MNPEKDHNYRCTLTDLFGRDAIDRAVNEFDAEVDEQIVIDPYTSGTNNRRSDKELARMLDLIDSLPISESNGKDGDK